MRGVNEAGNWVMFKSFIHQIQEVLNPVDQKIRNGNITSLPTVAISLGMVRVTDHSQDYFGHRDCACSVCLFLLWRLSFK